MIMPPRKFQVAELTPAGVVLLYAVFATLWIITSSQLLIITVADPVLMGRIELAKGLLFVAITSLLLYLLLRVRDTTSVQNTAIKPIGTRYLLLIFSALALLAPLVGFTITKLHGPQIEREAYANLEAIARLKAEQIENWLDERYGDSKELAGDVQFVESVGQFVRHEQDDKLSRLILDRFGLMITDHHYTKILLLNSSGQLLLSTGEDVTKSPVHQHVVRQSLDSKQVQQSDIYRDEDGHIHLDWAVPLVVADA